MKHHGVHLLLDSCSSFLSSLTLLHAIKGPHKDMMPQKTREYFPQLFSFFGLYDFGLVETCSWSVCDMSVTHKYIQVEIFFFFPPAFSPPVHGKA